MDLIDVEIAKLDQHPQNPRRDVGDVTELAASIKEQGLLEPLIIAPAETPGRYVLIAGHRRSAAAKKARLATLPALVRTDLTDPMAQLEAMLVENLQRTDLTPVEEAEGYAQLKLFGAKPADIAARTGRTKKLVDQRLALMRLPEATRDRVHGRQITLDHAAKMVEFVGDAAMMARLESAVGSSNFDYMVQRLRDERTAAKRMAKATKELLAAVLGITIIDRPEHFGYGPTAEQLVTDVLGAYDGLDLDGMTREENIAASNAARDRAVAEHLETCAHHAAFVHPYTYEVTHVCRQPDVHPGWAERKSEQQGRPAVSPEEEAAKAKRATASAVRTSHVEAMFKGKLVPQLPVLRWFVRETAHRYNFDSDPLGQVLQLLGVEVPPVKAKEKRRAVVWEYIDTAGGVDELMRVILAYGLVSMELNGYGTLRDPWSWSDRDSKDDPAGKSGRWLRMLEATGYELSDVDKELHAEGGKQRQAMYAVRPAVPAGDDDQDQDDQDGDDEQG